MGRHECSANTSRFEQSMPWDLSPWVVVRFASRKRVNQGTSRLWFRRQGGENRFRRMREYGE
jgi:hypothetical protein